jgi:transcriptional regulator with XRE-family HTH domain
MNIDGNLTRLASDAEAFRTSARAVRLSKGLTQEELSKRAGVSRRWLSRFETGEDPEGVELHKALAIARALNFDVVLASKDTQ